MLKLSNKIVFITGATAGIGEACAKELAAQGAKLILTGRRVARLEKLRASLNTPTHIIELDVTDSRAVSEAIKNLPAEWRNIDVLINNAGLAVGLELIAEAEIDHWEQMIDTNIKGLLYVTRAILPNMLERKLGHIINIGSISGHNVYARGGVYCATKFAVRALSQTLKLELHGTPLRVTEIDPGLVETEFSLVRFKQDAEKAEKVYQGAHALTPADVADAVVYAASRPAHVNIMEMIITPVTQSSVSQIHRE